MCSWDKAWKSLPAKDIIRTIKSQDLTVIQLLANHTSDTLNIACHLAMNDDPLAITAFLLAAGKFLLGKENRYETFINMIVEKLIPLANSKDYSTNEFTQGSMSKIARTHEILEKRSSVLMNLEIIVLLKGEIEGTIMPNNQWKNAAPILRAAQVKYMYMERFNPYIIFGFNIYCICLFAGWR